MIKAISKEAFEQMKDQDLTFVAPLIWRNKKKIVATTVGAMVLAAIFMIFCPNYYRAETIFYPVNSSLLRPVVDGSESNLYYFGDDYDTDRLLSIGNSTKLAVDIVKSFNLADHYDMDTSLRKSRIRLIKKFKKHYTIEKTDYDGIRVSFEDVDPGVATSITNGIRNYIDQKTRNILDKSLDEIVISGRERLADKENRLIQLTEEIRDLQIRYNIYDTEAQAEALATLQAERGNNRNIKSQISDYTEGVALVRKLETEQEELNRIVIWERNNLEKVESSISRKQGTIHIIEEAITPDEKSRPHRLLFVLSTGIIAFFSIIFWVLIVDKLPK